VVILPRGNPNVLLEAAIAELRSVGRALDKPVAAIEKFEVVEDSRVTRLVFEGFEKVLSGSDWITTQHVGIAPVIEDGCGFSL
jgi:hypothetical protein